MREGAQVVDLDRQKTVGQRPPHNPVLQEAGKKSRENCNYLEPHTFS
jgi:hypothetical protein